MIQPSLGLLTFDTQVFERIWGGRKLETEYGMDLPPEKPIGEAWVISDHSSAESVINRGPFAGKTLHDLLTEAPNDLLGRCAQPTVHGRFPLLLKVLDARDVLSVQVHPDDAKAQELGEPDVGKTEMWHVLQSEPGSELYCGLRSDVTPELFRQAVEEQHLEDLMVCFPVQAGTPVFVPAGTVHAIGGGIVLAEIQQNSDLTYRLYDWGRLDAKGQPRELHIEKGLEAIHFGSSHSGPAHGLAYMADGVERMVLAACRYFAAEMLLLNGATHTRNTRGDSFHILLAANTNVQIEAAGGAVDLQPGQAALVPGCCDTFAVAGEGTVLDYYVPDIAEDIIAPLRAAGHADPDIIRLGGDPRHSDIRP